MADIFISYKREDRRVAERVSIALEQLGFDVWWDFDLLSGDRFRNVIRAVIDQCPAAVVLWSTRAITSDFVMDEATYAKAKGKLCPTRIDDVELPFGFGQIHTDDLSDWEGELSHPGFQALVRALETRIGRKGKLGAARQTPEAQAGGAELEAFKAAQLANNASALRAFLKDYPRGLFASFVRGQVETIEAHAPAGGYADAAAPPREPPPKRSEDRPPPPVAPRATSDEAPPEAARKSSRWIFPAAVVLVVAGGIGTLRMQPSEPGAATTLSAAPGAPAPAPQKAGLAAPYDLAQLDPKVRARADAARTAELAALAAAAEARDVATEAEKLGGPDDPQGDNVLGRHTTNDGDARGDHYAGGYDRGFYNGLGVYTYAGNAYNSAGMSRYEGGWHGGLHENFGVLYWRNAARLAGHFTFGESEGPSVFRLSNGQRYEGDWAKGSASGYGVFWDKDGQVKEAGLYKDALLVTPLGPQGKK